MERSAGFRDPHDTGRSNHLANAAAGPDKEEEVLRMSATERDGLISRALSGTPVTVFMQDSAHRVLWVENPHHGWTNETFVGITDADMLGEASQSAFRAAKQAALESGQERITEVEARGLGDEPDAPRTLRFTVKPLYDSDRAFAGYLCSSIDVTEDKQREILLKNLVREVAHRSKNMLAMVLGLASQTSRTTPDKDQFIQRFTGRIQSLAKSQDAITESDWRGARISELVSHQVVGVVPAIAGQITVTGADVELTPNGALHVGLALHELCTNAIAFGALSSPTGRIEISSKIKRCDGERRGVLTWWEYPRVIQNDHNQKRFGRMVLERIVPAAVNGQGSLELAEGGVNYTLEIGASELVD